MSDELPREQGWIVVPDAGEPVPIAPLTAGERSFEAEGGRWRARVAGGGATGSGALGLALIEAVHFWPEGAERPTREALTERGRLPHLYERELVALLAAARPLPKP